MNKKALTFGIITLILSGLTAGAYFVVKRFLNERQSMMMNHPQRREVRHIPTTTTQRNYTQKEIEEMRRKGTLPNTLKQPYIPPNAAGDAAVQQSLKTLQEVNKINEMNQRLMDQQRRNQEQNQRR